MPQRILITGGTGLVGKKLTTFLSREGYRINILTRELGLSPHNLFEWNINNQTIDSDALKDVDHILHLAGEGIAKNAWTATHRQRCYESRISSTRLLLSALKKYPNQVKSVICASAIGYYNQADFDHEFTERDAGTDGFLGDLTRDWESIQSNFKKEGKRFVSFRTRIVLTDRGGALPKMLAPIKNYCAGAIGTGKQWVSWIHIDDLVRLFHFAVKNDALDGIYNAVAPHPVTNAEFIKTAAQVTAKPYFLPNIPRWVMQLILGKKAELVTMGAKVSSKKVETAGFSFRYATLDKCLQNLLARKNN